MAANAEDLPPKCHSASQRPLSAAWSHSSWPAGLQKLPEFDSLYLHGLPMARRWTPPSRVLPECGRTSKARGNPFQSGSEVTPRKRKGTPPTWKCGRTSSRVAPEGTPLARPEQGFTSKRGNPPGSKNLTRRDRSHLGVGSALDCFRRKL